MTSPIEYKVKGSSIRTDGLRNVSGFEIAVEYQGAALAEEAMSYLSSVANLVTAGEFPIRDNAEVAYGYWETLLKLDDTSTLRVWEYATDWSRLIPGATLALTYWRDQNVVCRTHGSEFDPPDPRSMVVLSKGVIEGRPVEAVRYHSPSHMSGWWFTTDEYDGNIKSLTTHHIYHLTAARPELAKYLALTFGYRLDLRRHERVWFDQKVASDHAAE